MAKTIGQSVIGMGLLVLVTQFSTKTGITVGEVVKGIWNIFVTIGKAFPVPGGKSAAVLPLVGMVFGRLPRVEPSSPTTT